MKAAKTDANQKAIVAALRKAGASVQVLSDKGQGVPDLIIGYKGMNYLIECKTEKGVLNKRQIKWFSSWLGQVAVVRTIDEALTVIHPWRKYIERT